MSIKVKNIKITEKREVPKGYKSWLEYWKKNTDKEYEYCCNAACCNDVHAIGQVEIIERPGRKYIVGLCKECKNNYDMEYNVHFSDLIPLFDDEK